MDLNEYQRLANRTDQWPASKAFESDQRNLMIPLLGLASEVGELLGEHKKWLRDGESYRLFPDRVKEELGDLLWYVSNVATKHGFSLEDVAQFNLHKTRSRWQPIQARETRWKLLDDDFPPSEQLPRQMDVLIRTDASDQVTMFIDGAEVGDPLRDNRYEDDGYRFHDVFHLSFASMLGWSPTLRALLRRKRKSAPRVDEVEDGGRALVIEEGISAMVFSYAERRNFLDGAEEVDYGLLRTIKEMTEHLEVSCRTEWDWESTILAGYHIWRQIRERNSGHILADLENRRLEFVGRLM